MSRAAVLAVDGGNSKTDLALVAPTARCSRSSAAAELAPPPRRRRVSGGGRRTARGGGARGELGDHAGQVAEVATAAAWPASTSPRKRTRRRAPSKRGGGRSASRRQRHVRRPPCRHRARLGCRRHVRRRHQLRGRCTPDGRHARFPALGAITGDWGGGYDLGLAAVSAAARSEDGRGPGRASSGRFRPTSAWPTPSELAEGSTPGGSSSAASPSSRRWCFAEAADDAVAAEIVEHLAAEVVALARVALTRLELTQEPVEVLLGGGVLQDVDGDLLAIDRFRPARGARRTSPSDRPLRRHRRRRAARARRARGRAPMRRRGCGASSGAAFSQLEGVATVG